MVVITMMMIMIEDGDERYFGCACCSDAVHKSGVLILEGDRVKSLCNYVSDSTDARPIRAPLRGAVNSRPSPVREEVHDTDEAVY